MAMHLNKPVAVIVIAALLSLGVVALIFGGALASLTKGGATTTNMNESHASSTSLASGNTSNASFMGMDVIPTNRLVPLGGSANFTVVLYNGGGLTGGYSLSAVVPPGLSIEFDSASVNMTGCERCGADLRVQSSSATDAGAYQVTIEATGPKGVTSQTFDFHVQRNLVLLSSLDVHQFTNLTLKVGDNVTWVALDGPFGDVPNGWHQVIFSNSTLTSGWILGPLWTSNPQWSYDFKQPGIYRYYDYAFPTITGEIVVKP